MQRLLKILENKCEKELAIDGKAGKLSEALMLVCEC
jgi:hypothetical protein